LPRSFNPVEAFLDHQAQRKLASQFEDLPSVSLLFPREVDRVQRRLVQKKVQQGRVECLDDEEEDLFNGNVQQFRAHDHIFRVAPYRVADEIAIPWYRRRDGDGDQKGDLVEIEARA
jgi:hypothetical protein